MSGFCTQCGAPRGVEGNFCEQCGAAFDPARRPEERDVAAPMPEQSVDRPAGRNGRRAGIVLVGAAVAIAAAAGWMAVRDDEDAVESVAGPASTGSAETAEPPGRLVDVGIAQSAAPDPAALIWDESGHPLPGDQVLVALRDGAGPDVAERVASTVSGEVVGQIELINLWQVRIPPTDLAGLDATIEGLLADADVELAAANVGSTPDEEIWGERLDPMRDPPYDGSLGDGFRMIGVETAWQYLRGSGLPRHGVKVGVTDSGLYRGPDPELSEFPIERDGAVKVEFPDPNAGEIDAADVPEQYADDVASGKGSHGTGVLTVLAGDPDDGGAFGVAGDLGDDLTVVHSNVFAPPYGGYTEVPSSPADQTGSAPSTTLPLEQVQASDGRTWVVGNLKAIADQVRSGAKVINMSWGTDEPPTGRLTTRQYVYTAAIYRAFFERMAERHPDVLFVASAGNDGRARRGATRWPGGLALPNMITVGNLENDGSTATSSNRVSDDHEVTLAAPGNGAVRGVGPDGVPIADGGGTSNAAPQVSGAAALLLSIKPDLTAAQIKDLLTSTARTSIVRSDGTERAIDADVGGRALAVDLAVFELIKSERLRLGLDEPNPDGTSPLTPEQLLDMGVVDSVATSTETGWNVRGIVRGCAPTCTSVSIQVSEGSAVAGETTQALASPGEAVWSVTLTELPGTITVRRSDNGAGSRIIVPEASAQPSEAGAPSLLDGTWTGELVITYQDPDVVGSLVPEMDPGNAYGVVWLVSTGPDGAGVVDLELQHLGGSSFGLGGVRSGSIAVEGASVTLSEQDLWTGSISADGSTISGSWSMLPDAEVSGTFTVSRS